MSTRNEPLLFVSHTKLYNIYKKDLKIWSRITEEKKELQAKAVVFSLKDQASNIMEKIQADIWDKLEGNKQGIDKLIKYLDGIYLKDEKIKKQKIPDVSPERIEDQKVPNGFLDSDKIQEVTQTDDIEKEELLNQMEDVLFAQGWQRSGELRRTSNGNPRGAEKKSPNYKKRRTS